MLAIQEYLKKHGLEKTIDDFKLKSRDYEKKILLKYDQLVSNSLMGMPEMQDCRGIVLEKGTWKVMSLAFRKFFNAEEGNAAKVDWNTAQVLEKLDGSLIQVYWDWHKNTWFAATTGTAEGEGEVNNKLGTTFNDLFWNTINNKYTFNECLLNKDLVYVFELTTPYNIVVKPHAESSVTILTIRNRETLEEISGKDLEMASISIGVPLVKSFDLNVKDVGGLLRTFEGMPWSEEGYVVVDAKFNRVKVKNPAYVAAHHLKGKTAEHNIMTIVKANEIEEFAATFHERKDELYRLKENYDKLTEKLNDVWSELSLRKPKNITKEEQKRYAAAVFEVCGKYDLKQFTGLYFSLAQYKVNSVEDFLFAYDDKLLYKML
jgi:RNA ligase